MSYTRKYKEQINEKVTKKITLKQKISISDSREIYLCVDGHDFFFGDVQKEDIEKDVFIIAEIPVHFDITVDTKPFDKSVKENNAHIKLLTETVETAEAAQVAAKIKSAEDISDTVVKGFYGLIKSEINQQINEIKPRVESLLVELHHQRDACLSKKNQLTGDFERIAERYTKIFHELDKELVKRISLLDKAVIHVHETLTHRVSRTLSDASTGISTVFHQEESDLHARLFTPGARNRVISLLEHGKNYLQAEHTLTQQLRESLNTQSMPAVDEKFVPIIYLKSIDATDHRSSRVVVPPQFDHLAHKQVELMSAFDQEAHGWPYRELQQLDVSIEKYMTREIGGLTPRVAELMRQLWAQQQSIQTNL
jgi:hypothetical protein